MNLKREREVAQLRCENKSVKFISKKLAMNRNDIERIITRWIIETDYYIDKAVSGHKSTGNPDPRHISAVILSGSNILPMDGEILDYATLHRSDHHDRIMDCIRYHILRSVGDAQQ
ncbi:MAG: hypothetical protein ACP5OC_08320 [Thermoplasmata archaeon]